MKWLELSVTAPPEFVEPLSQIFYRYGHGGVALESEGGYNPDEGETAPTNQNVTIRTYLPINNTTERRRGLIDIGVSLVAHVCPIEPLQERELDEEEWQNSWKEHFHVLHIGKNIVIRPTWREYEPKPTDVVIRLDPGMAFGTGHHPTTRMCLELLEELLTPGMDVIDLGCGSGILSMAASKLGARSVFGLEIDSVAVGVAKQNIRDNGGAQNIRIAQGTLPHQDAKPDSFDIAVANISAKIVSEAIPHLVTTIRPNGKFIASGILVENKKVVEDALKAAGWTVDQLCVDTDWVALVASKA